MTRIHQQAEDCMVAAGSENYTNVSSPNCTVALSRAFGVMSFNPAAGQLLGSSPKPGETYPLEKIFAVDDLYSARSAVGETLTHGRSSRNIKARINSVSGKKILCEYSTQPLFDRQNAIIGVILNFHSIPKTPRSSESPDQRKPFLHLPRSNYLNLIEDLPEGVFTVDTNRRITSFNRTAEKITGFLKKEVIGRHCQDIFRTDLCQDNCPLNATIITGEKRMDEEVCTRNRMGERQTLLVNTSILQDETGSVIGAVETFRVPPERQSHHMDPETWNPFSGMVGHSAAMQSIFGMLPDVAASEANILISGESGTGKDVLAQTIHRLSKNSNGPFSAVNCAALAESLLESELFGHEKGAFTGADRAKPGRFELAAGGTLYLDEIGELRADLQVKLLRVLEEREFERVGGTHSVALAARIISATNKNLTTARREGRFREDLFYRLRTVPIHIPPLRERPEDIPHLVKHFIKKFNLKYAKAVRSIDPKVMRRLTDYHWPGNIRELERCIEHAFVFVKGPVIFGRHLPDFQDDPPTTGPMGIEPQSITKSKDKAAILWALSKANGNRQKAAALLGISRTTMWRRMKLLEHQ